MKKLALMTAVVAVAGLVSAQNLISNPTFAPVNDGWSGYDSVVTVVDPIDFVTSAGGVATVTPSDNAFAPAELNYYAEYNATLAAGLYEFSIDASNITADGGPTVFVKEFDGGWGWIGWTPIAMVDGSNVINFTAAAGNIYQVGTLTNGNTTGSYDLSNPSLVVVPEPATIGLMGIAGLCMFARRRMKI